MSSLWTPDGERSVSPTPANTSATETDDSAEVIDPQLEAEYREEMERLEAELLSAPVSDVIANHCYGLFQLGAMHLGQQPPRTEDAKLAIDALGAIIETLGERLGASAPTLNEGLAQIRLAFVQIAAAHDTPEDEPL
jgi:hypothetical protein